MLAYYAMMTSPTLESYKYSKEVVSTALTIGSMPTLDICKSTDSYKQIDI